MSCYMQVLCTSAGVSRLVKCVWTCTCVLLVCLTAILASGQSVTATLNVGKAPIAAAVNPVTNKIYVANASDDSVTVIDGAANTMTAVNTGSGPAAIALNPVTSKIDVAN